MDEEAIFAAAIAFASTAARATYLDEACGGDEQLRGRVEALIHSHENAGSFLGEPAAPVSPAIDQPPLERTGTHIGPYRLLEKLGEGGMGVVFLAEQKEPVERQVALKIIRPGMDTLRVIDRFEAERQALAVMDHPHVAKVLDAGTTDSGRPYFVMELVQGIAITKYCDLHELSIRERLELFIPVCQAVQHAHQKGIIHRDIKPSNILVAEFDGHPVPKVIDFGVAKAIDHGTVQKQLSTQFGQIVGTLEYMSPEQARLSAHDVDTRSDVYSLGAVLYELLTGITPFDKHKLYSAAFDQALHMIEAEEPPKPSLRLSSSDSLPSVATLRHIEPQRLTALIRGELDWIVMRALEKDRSRRYESATALAQDVQRYLRDEPVEACPPSTLYQLRKFTRRNRTVVVATAAVSLALVLGAGIATGQAIRATKAEKLAEQQLQIAQQQKRLAEEGAERERDLRVQAEAARKQAEKVTDFLVEIFRSPDPERDGRTITVAETLDQAKTRVETEFPEDPLLQAKLLGAIGKTYSGLGLVQEALELTQKSSDMLRDALGPEHVDTLAAMQDLADAYQVAGQWDEALPLKEKTLRLRKEVLGAQHPDTLKSMNSLADYYRIAGQLDQALSLNEETLRLRKETLGPEHPDTLGSLNNLASVYHDGRWNEALPLHEEALRLSRAKLGPEHPDTLASMNNLAGAYSSAGRWNEALPLYEETLRLAKAKLGSDHPTTLTIMANLAGVYRDAGQLEKALFLDEETLKLSKAKLGPEHPDTLRALNNLACMYWSLDKLKQSVPLFEETLRIQKRVCGEDDPETIKVMANLGVNYWSAGRLDQAIPLLEEALRKVQEKHAPDLALTTFCMYALAEAYLSAGRFDEAVRLGEDRLRLHKEKLGPDHVETLKSMTALANAYRKAGRYEEAVRLATEMWELTQKVLPPDDRQTLRAKRTIGATYSDAGRVDEAIKLLEETVQRQREVEGPQHRQTLTTLHYLAVAYSRAGQLDRAVALLKETVQGRQKTLGPEHPDTLESMILLGGIHVQRDEFAAAEPLLLEAYQGFAKRQAAGSTPYDDQQVREALTQLVQLYEKSNQPDKAKEWKEKLDATPSGSRGR